MRTRVFLLFILFISISGSQDKHDDRIFSWPLGINNGYSSAFQEFRPGHFHGGIDLRTFQKTGYPVLSVMDGYIYKIRSVNRGSGNGIYVQHENGLKSIFFHLEKFSLEVEKIVEKLRSVRGEKYFGNYVLKNPLIVKKGEIIGYTGETGSGFPHLHLEVRDQDETLINPFRLINFPLPDRNFPVLKKLIFRSVGSAAIDGQVGEQAFALKKISKNRYVIPERISINGEFEMVLNTLDISDTGKHVAPAGIELFLEGKKIYDLKFEKFGYEDNNQLGFVYDMFFSSSGSYFFNLFSQTGFSMLKNSIGTGELFNLMHNGDNHFLVRVYDNFNNDSSAEFVVDKYREPVLNVKLARKTGTDPSLMITECSTEDVSEVTLTLADNNKNALSVIHLDPADMAPGKKFPLPANAAGSFTFAQFRFFRYQKPVLLEEFSFSNPFLDEMTDIRFDEFVNRDSIIIKIESDRIGLNNIILETVQGERKELLKPQADAAGLFFRIKPLNDENSLLLSFTILNNDLPSAYIQKTLSLIRLSDGLKQNPVFNEFSVFVGKRSVRETKILTVKKVNFPTLFPMESDQYRVYPYSFPFLDTVYFKFKVTADNPVQLGIFRYSIPGKKWTYSGTAYDEKKHVFYTRSITPGIYCLMRDIFKPVISFSVPKIITMDTIDKIKIILTDKGKGIDDDHIVSEMNGIRLNSEYDPDWKSLTLENAGTFIRPGLNIIRIQVKDHAGNTSTANYKFRFNRSQQNGGV